MGGHGSCGQVLYLLVMVAVCPVFTFSFSFSRFDKQDPVFASMVSLLGDAEVDGDRLSVRLTRPMTPSSGGIVFNRAVELPAKGPVKVVAFTAGFSFSISPGRADGLAFLLVPKRLRRRALARPPPMGVSPGVVAVEFDTKLDAEVGDPSPNHVGIDIGSLASVSARDADEAGLVLNSGEKVHAWVGYDLNSKELRVWMGKAPSFSASELLISYHFDLPEIFRDGFYVCLSSSSDNATTGTLVYSWDFKLRRIASSVHSQPLDPRAASDASRTIVVRSRSDPLLRTLAGMIFGAGCGAILAVLALVSWSAVVERRRRLAPQVYPAYPVEGGYEEIVLSGGKKVQVVNGKMLEKSGAVVNGASEGKV